MVDSYSTTVKNTRHTVAILVIVRSVPMELETQEIMCQVRSPSVIIKLTKVLAVTTVVSTVLRVHAQPHIPEERPQVSDKGSTSKRS